MRKILLIGANSFVGKRLVEFLQDKYVLTGTFHKKKNKFLGDERQVQLDITKQDSVNDVLEKTKPDVVIITAAVSTNKEAEEKINSVNVTGASNVVLSIKEMGVKEQGVHPKIIFFSTEQIFDGSEGLYAETDEPSPINKYGKSKLEAEKIIQTYDDYLILRLALILGDKKPDDHDNFISLMLDPGKGKDLKVFNNVYRTFIYVEDIPLIIHTLIEKDQKGILNVSEDEFLSYAEMAELVEKEFNISRHEVIECKDPNIPRRLGLSNNLLKKLIDFQLTSYKDMLVRVKDKINNKI